jgi:hypothetical protein
VDRRASVLVIVLEGGASNQRSSKLFRVGGGKVLIVIARLELLNVFPACCCAGRK